MSDALQAFGIGFVSGFGLSLFGYILGTVIGNSLALFDVD